MSLAKKASIPISNVPSGYTISCHTAIWYYAAEEAQERGMSRKKTTKEILDNILAIPEGPQQAILDLQQSGTWDFEKTPTTPIDGTVLVWLKLPTHSAIVTAKDAISGYDQGKEWRGAGFGYTTENPNNIVAEYSIVKTVLEDAIVAEAARRDL